MSGSRTPHARPYRKEDFVEALEAYERPIYGYFQRMLGDADEARDLTQEVFLRLWRNGRPERASEKTWLFRVARNLFIDRVRRRRPRAFGSDGVEPPDPSPPPLERLAVDEMRQRALAALDGLPELYREVTILRYQEGLSVQQISRVLGLRRNTVAVRLVRARQMLRKSLGSSQDRDPASLAKEGQER